jgi:hypothetical protein
VAVLREEVHHVTIRYLCNVQGFRLYRGNPPEPLFVDFGVLLHLQQFFAKQLKPSPQTPNISSAQPRQYRVGFPFGEKFELIKARHILDAKFNCNHHTSHLRYLAACQITWPLLDPATA